MYVRMCSTLYKVRIPSWKFSSQHWSCVKRCIPPHIKSLKSYINIDFTWHQITQNCNIESMHTKHRVAIFNILFWCIVGTKPKRFKYEFNAQCSSSVLNASSTRCSVSTKNIWWGYCTVKGMHHRLLLHFMWVTCILRCGLKGC